MKISKLKNIIKTILFCIVFLQNTNITQSQDLLEGNYEIAVRNLTDNNIRIQLYPVSAVFNYQERYSLVAKSRTYITLSNGHGYDYINGASFHDDNGTKVLDVFQTIPSTTTTYVGWNDDDGANEFAYGSFGFGNYKLLIYNMATSKYDSCIIQLDYYSNSLPWGTPGDLYFEIHPDGVTPRFTYQFFRSTGSQNYIVEINYNTVNGYTAKSWDPNGTGTGSNFRDKKFGPEGGFVYEDYLGSGFDKSVFPLDSRRDCDIIWPANNFFIQQNQIFDFGNVLEVDERAGIIPLDLTIKKKVNTPTYQVSNECEFNTAITIEPDVIFKIDKLNNPNRGVYLSCFQGRLYGHDLSVKSSSNLYQGRMTTLLLEDADNFDNNAILNINKYCNVIVENDAKLYLGDYAKVNLDNTGAFAGKMILNNGSEVVFNNNSEININPYAEVTNKGAIITNNGLTTININQNGKYILESNVVHNFDNGARLLMNDGNLILGDNSQLIFDGATSYMQVDNLSDITLGNNAKIEFKNGAKLIASGSTFSAAQNSIWKGLYFENSGTDDIQNCTFSGAEYPIDIKCENQSSALVLKKIKQNIFNLTGSGKTAIKTNNAINLLIDDNTINMPSDLSNTPAVYLRNALTFSINGGGNSEDVTSIRVINNDINNGSNSIIIANYVSSFLPVLVDNNVCYNSSSSPFIGRYITGTISNNNFDNQGKTYGKGAVIHQGNPELFRNRIYSKDAGLTLLSSAVVNMSPSGYGSNQLLWIGGENNISSTVSHTLNFNSTSYANIDFGHNNFYKTDAASTHLYGSLSIQGTDYYVRENCWYNTNIPICNLLNSQGTPVNVIWQGGNYTCNIGISQLDSVMLDWGAGVYQYIPVSNIGQQQNIVQDELLYGQSVQQASASNYPTAINLLKQLINEYQSSQYLSTSLYDLFAYYEELDTSQSAGERDILYGNLKTYLNERILSGLYDYQFESDAFYIIVMCEANMMNTQLAVDDFQFLSLYHPQPEVRLLASWDYTELEALNGQGGSIKEFKSEEEMMKYVENIAKRIGKKYESDPLRSRLMKTYKKINDEYTSKEETLKSELSRAGNEKNEKIMTQKAELDTRKDMNKTASMNIVSLRSMPEKQKEERRFNDLMIISGIKNTESKKSVNNNNITPEKYELGQNYPNPFNPVTNIQFQVPSLKFVKLVVYDLLGREVKTLVNEIKSPGKYIVSFDASSLSSGVYFYKMTAGEFTNVKRMVLVK